MLYTMSSSGTRERILDAARALLESEARPDIGIEQIAKRAGDLATDEDIDALVFDLDALLYYAHGAFSFRDDPAVLAQAALSVRQRLGRGRART